jgi:D-inositol-3-phosphate glycosyltransferase
MTIKRVAAISLHTSPLAQPGVGDAGGMNVYVEATARRLAARGVAVDIFTRATSSAEPPVIEVADGVTVRHVVAGPFEGLQKNDLPGQLCSFAAGVLRVGAFHDVGHYSIVHSHYWLSGQVGFLAKDRWVVPLVHSAHTLGRVKNAWLADGDEPEPPGRLIGEDQVIAEADRLIANTDAERTDLIELYGAAPERVDVVAPGVDTELFVPGDMAGARIELGISPADRVLVFAGRIQPLKGPDVLLRALRVLIQRYPDEPWRVLVVGGISGSGRSGNRSLAELAAELGVQDSVTFLPPQPRERLVTVFQAAAVVAVPSYNESFGLVAMEAQASGTPVVAAAVGGLPVAVQDGLTGTLVDGHDPESWAHALAAIALDPDCRAHLAGAARVHAEKFSWDVTAEALLASYERAIFERAGLDRRSG